MCGYHGCMHCVFCLFKLFRCLLLLRCRLWGQVGGNQRLRKLFKKLDIDKQPITVKYQHPALEEYRERYVRY
jgi:hypothetical protein